VVYTTTPNEKARFAARRMQEHNVGTLVVVDLGGKAIGLLTDRDVAMRCVAESRDCESTPVSEIMTSPVTLVEEDTAIETAVQKMAASQVRRLVVVDEHNRLAGLLSLDDVLDLLIEESESIGMILHAQTPV
jgi:CBS domain-containing protein